MSGRRRGRCTQRRWLNRVGAHRPFAVKLLAVRGPECSGPNSQQPNSVTASRATRRFLVQSRRRAIILLLAVVAAGCAAQPVQRRDWSEYDGPGAAAFQGERLAMPDVPDPLEPVNRGVWAFNHGFIEWVADPLGRVYRAVVPRFARDRIRDFGANLVFPRNALANLLQGDRRGVSNETIRVVVNSTVGLAGFWDPATRWFGVDAEPADFGQVFAHWGWLPSTYVVLPVMGPSTARDGAGLVPDALLDPAFYVFPASFALTANEQVDSIDDYRRLAASSFDVYDDARLVWSVAREASLAPPEIRAQGDDTGAVQTLQAAMLGPRDSAFFRRLTTGAVTMPGHDRPLPYSYRLQPGSAPLVFIVPGLGAHRLSAASLALAELAWSRGFSVAIVSSALNPEFIERGGSVPVPGHAPVDARDVHVALDGIARALDARFPGRVGARIYLGYSLGAFHGFYLAAAEETAPTGLVRFDRYVLLDPPVRLVDGMERLDAFYEGPLALPEPERDAEVHRILRKTALVAQRAMTARSGRHDASRVDAVDLGDGLPPPNVELPFTNEEAEFLIGLQFRRSLLAILYASQEREDLGVLRTERRRGRRQPVYQEMADYSFMQYFYAFVLPYHRDRLGTVTSREDLVAANDLHAIAAPLRGNARLRVFANDNDFLTSDADVEWLTETVGADRVRFFPTGGHLGGLHRPEVQAEVIASLDDLRPPAASPPAPRAAAPRRHPR